MQDSKALQTTRQQVWTDPSGTHYLVQRELDGVPTFLPLSPVEPPAATPLMPLNHQRVTTNRDPLALGLICLGALLGVVFLGYWIGFFAGASGQRVVMVPREPVCTTHRSSFLFWNSETKDCQ